MLDNLHVQKCFDKIEENILPLTCRILLHLPDLFVSLLLLFFLVIFSFIPTLDGFPLIFLLLLSQIFSFISVVPCHVTAARMTHEPELCGDMAQALVVNHV